MSHINPCQPSTRPSSSPSFTVSRSNCRSVSKFTLPSVRASGKIVFKVLIFFPTISRFAPSCFFTLLGHIIAPNLLLTFFSGAIQSFEYQHVMHIALRLLVFNLCLNGIPSFIRGCWFRKPPSSTCTPNHINQPLCFHYTEECFYLINTQSGQHLQ